jgi:fructose-1-phosphate kinase PfkB-like protein
MAALEESQRLVQDLCAKNEVLVSQLEQLPRLHRAQIERLQASTNEAIERAKDAQKQAHEMANSRIWKLLVRAGGVVLRLSGRSQDGK